MADFWYKISLEVIPRIFMPLAHLWFCTCRVKVVGQENFKTCEDTPTIACFWHYSFVYQYYRHRNYPSAIMVSTSREGEYSARLAKLMGHFPVRGSSNRGKHAFRSIIKLIKQGKHAAMVIDGSQGPARKAQPGVILAASMTGAPLLPIAWAASRYIKLNSWDKTAIPLPFSTIVVHYGTPIYVTKKPDSEETEQLRQRLEHDLNAIYDKSWEMLGKPAHDQQTT